MLPVHAMYAVGPPILPGPGLLYVPAHVRNARAESRTLLAKHGRLFRRESHLALWRVRGAFSRLALRNLRFVRTSFIHSPHPHSDVFRWPNCLFAFRPQQLQIYNTPAANVDRLLTIAEMKNKYHFASIELWAVDALHNVLSGLYGDPQPQYDLRYCSSAWMKRVLEVALLCKHDALRNYVVERWVERIFARELRPVHAFEIADRGGIRRLLGCAYYVQLLEMGDSFDPGVIEDGKQYSRSRLRTVTIALNGDGNGNDGTSMSAPTSTAASLTCEQRERLLSGAWSLAQLWETLRTTPPMFQRPDECKCHKQGCLSTWRVAWREAGKAEATLKHRSGDVLGRLRAMQEQLVVHENLSSLTPECRRSALAALKRTIKEVQEDLADHFSNLTFVQLKESVESNVAEGSS